MTTSYSRRLLWIFLATSAVACTPVQPQTSEPKSQHDIPQSQPILPRGRSKDGLVLVGGAKGFWANLPAILYEAESFHLVEIRFVDRKGLAYSHDLHDAKDLWHTGQVSDGRLTDLVPSGPPTDAWLSQLSGAAILLVLNNSAIVPVPPLDQIDQTLRLNSRPAGEVKGLIRLAADHLLLVHMSNGSAYSGCQHREILAIGASIMATVSY